MSVAVLFSDDEVRLVLDALADQIGLLEQSDDPRNLGLAAALARVRASILHWVQLRSGYEAPTPIR